MFPFHAWAKQIGSWKTCRYCQLMLLHVTAMQVGWSFLQCDVNGGRYYLVMFLTALWPLLNARSILIPALFRLPINVLVSALLAKILSLLSPFPAIFMYP